MTKLLPLRTRTRLRRLSETLSRLGFQIEDDVKLLRESGQGALAERVLCLREDLQSVSLALDNAAEGAVQ